MSVIISLFVNLTAVPCQRRETQRRLRRRGVKDTEWRQVPRLLSLAPLQSAATLSYLGTVLLALYLPSASYDL